MSAKQERVNLQVSGSPAAVLNGNDDVSTWDDDELAYGRRRNKSKGFSGGHPRVIPVECVRELNRRRLFETESIIRDACVNAAVYLASVVNGEDKPVAGRLKAAETILDRFLGKPAQQVQMQAKVEVEMAPWESALRGLVFVGDGPSKSLPPAEDGIVDAEVVEVVEVVNADDTPPERWRDPFKGSDTYRRHHKNWRQEDARASFVGDVEWETAEDDDPVFD